jgi:predicted nuclease with TOPRIM domain
MKLKYIFCSNSQNCLEVEKHKLKEEVCKLETRNEDLRQKLDAVVSRNQLLSEEKADICMKNSLNINTLQEHSEKWRQL